jgi:hypothetical protein
LRRHLRPPWRCGLSIDAAVSAEGLRVLKPLHMDAVVKAIEARTCEMSTSRGRLELSVQQAGSEAARQPPARAVDAANRLVAGDWGRWDEAF